MFELKHFHAARAQARRATQERLALQRQMEQSEYTMMAAYDKVFREMTNVLTDDPVALLEHITASDLSKVLRDVWWVERQRIFSEHAPERLPDANDLYCYSFPGATEELWTAFRDAADTLGFYPKAIYPIHVRYRRQQQYTLIRRLHILDRDRARQNRAAFDTMLDALLTDVYTDVVRVFSKTDEVAEYVESGSGISQWVIYDDQQSMFRPSVFTDIRDGGDHPLDFL